MDEPLDSGVLVEIMFAKSLGIPTVGYRCDSRSPFGNLQEWNFGMHFFPLIQFDYFFNSVNDARKSSKESQRVVDELVEKMHEKMKKLQRKETLHQHEELLNLAYELIPSPLNPCDIQLSEIVRKYNEMKDRLEKFEPKIFKI